MNGSARVFRSEEGLTAVEMGLGYTREVDGIEMASAAQAASEIPEKSLFRIGEVSRLTATKAFVLRYWESEFPTLQPVKSPSGHRLYRREDIETVFEIKRLLYEEGFTPKRRMARQTATRLARALFMAKMSKTSRPLRLRCTFPFTPVTSRRQSPRPQRVRIRNFSSTCTKSCSPS